MTKEELLALNNVIDYLYVNEKEDYEGSIDKTGHIFLDIKKLDRYYKNNMDKI